MCNSDGKFRQTSIASDARKNDNKEVESDVDMISLPHPSNGDSTKFIIYNNRLLELQHMHREDSIHSWFVNQNVVEGNLYISYIIILSLCINNRIILLLPTNYYKSFDK